MDEARDASASPAVAWRTPRCGRCRSAARSRPRETPAARAAPTVNAGAPSNGGGSGRGGTDMPPRSQVCTLPGTGTPDLWRDRAHHPPVEEMLRRAATPAPENLLTVVVSFIAATLPRASTSLPRPPPPRPRSPHSAPDSVTPPRVCPRSSYGVVLGGCALCAPCVVSGSCRRRPGDRRRTTGIDLRTGRPHGISTTQRPDGSVVPVDLW